MGEMLQEMPNAAYRGSDERELTTRDRRGETARPRAATGVRTRRLPARPPTRDLPTLMHLRADGSIVHLAHLLHLRLRQRRQVSRLRVLLGLLGILRPGDDAAHGVEHQNPPQRELSHR